MKKYFEIFKEILFVSPVFIIGYYINTILSSLPAYIANVYFLKIIVDRITAGCQPIDLFLPLIYLFVFLFLSDLYMSLFDSFIQPLETEKIKRHFHEIMRSSILEKDLSLYDDPNYYNDIVYIESNIYNTGLSILNNTSKMVAGIINIFLVFSLFSEMGIALILLTFCAVITVLILGIPISKLENERKYSFVSNNRERNYFFDCFFNASTFKERKTTGVSRLLFQGYDAATNSIKNTINKYGVKIAFIEFIKEGISSTLIMNFFLIIYLVYKVIVEKSISCGDFISSYNGVNIIISTVLELFACFALVRQDGFVIQKYFNFKSCIGNNKIFKKIDINSIQLKDISFTYPNTEKEILHNINLSIKKGEKIAFVGKNGSGKTTLIHLLMGLYHPTKGKIIVNQSELTDMVSYRHSFCTFFQNEQPFSASIAENVALDVDYDVNLVEKALLSTDNQKLAVLDFKTMIGKEFDNNGLLLSGGEIQKLLLSHCIYSDKEIIVLDEPSAALDPISEKKLNECIFNASMEKTIIFISHRLSSVSMADRIYMIDEGKIIEDGTHEQLIRNKRLYKEMWDIQVEKYKTN